MNFQKRFEIQRVKTSKILKKNIRAKNPHIHIHYSLLQVVENTNHFRGFWAVKDLSWPESPNYVIEVR